MEGLGGEGPQPFKISREGEWKHSLDIKALQETQERNFILVIYQLRKTTYELEKLDNETTLNHGWVLNLEEDMPWLGLREPLSSNAGSIINNTSLFPSYQRMKRSGTLPGKCRIQLDDEEALSYVQLLWDGKAVYHVDTLFEVVEEEAIEVIPFRLTVTTKDGKKLFECFGFPKGSSKDILFQFMPCLKDRLDRAENELLTARLMHHFIRQFAYLVPCHLLDDLLYDSYLERTLTSKKCKEQLLDWQILKMDLLLNFPSPDVDDLSIAIHGHCWGIGNRLASLNRWEEAGLFLTEVGDIFQSDEYSYSLAGTAFEHVYDVDLREQTGFYNSSLEMHLKHFQQITERHPDYNLKEDPQEDNIFRIYCVHHALYERHIAQHNTADPLKKGGHGNFYRNDLPKEAAASLAFAALYSVSELFPRSYDFLQRMFGIPRNGAKAMLKTQYQNRRRAEKKLLSLMMMNHSCTTKATTAGSMEGYKEGLIGVLRPNGPISLEEITDSTRSDSVRKEARKRAAKSAFNIAKKDNLSKIACAYCGQWSNPEHDSFIMCQCELSHYCDEECRQSDWKLHKRLCPWYIEKKSTKGKKEACNATMNSHKVKTESSTTKAGDGDLQCCSACGMPQVDCKEKFKFCPCKEEAYCCKQCQVLDWKQHKKTCPWNIAKNQSKVVEEIN